MEYLIGKKVEFKLEDKIKKIGVVHGFGGECTSFPYIYILNENNKFDSINTLRLISFKVIDDLNLNARKKTKNVSKYTELTKEIHNLRDEIKRQEQKNLRLLNKNKDFKKENKKQEKEIKELNSKIEKLEDKIKELNKFNKFENLDL